MTDTEFINWIVLSRAQLWRDKKSRLWTVQVIVNGQVVQPSQPDLRNALMAAFIEWEKMP